MEPLRLYVNDELIEVRDAPPTTTLLDFLRREKRLTSVKEGCAEGDCGACTVALLDPEAAGGPRYRAVNACLLLLPMVQGKRIYTAEGLAGEKLHTAQQEIVDKLGSQCGFCTPGVVMSMFEATYREDVDADWQVDDQLAGNLCRCTGYRPIREAARAVAGARPDDRFAGRLATTRNEPPLAAYQVGERCFHMPSSFEALFDALESHPEARLVAGGTDVGLDITQRHQDIPCLVSVEALPGLRAIENTDDGWRFGAGLPLTDLEYETRERLIPVARMLRFFGSRQIKHRGTLGGNLANASPIGDLAPVLLSLGARAVLRSRAGRRTLPLDDFFLAYRKTALTKGEILEAIEVPRIPADARAAAYKVSKRRELDISTVSASFMVRVDDAGLVTEARLAYGGLAATPARARRTEAALVGQPWTEATVEAVLPQVDTDFTPIDDHRGSAWYRRTVARNLLRGFFLETRTERLPRLPAQPSGTVQTEVA